MVVPSLVSMILTSTSHVPSEHRSWPDSAIVIPSPTDHTLSDVSPNSTAEQSAPSKPGFEQVIGAAPLTLIETETDAQFRSEPWSMVTRIKLSSVAVDGAPLPSTALKE